MTNTISRRGLLAGTAGLIAAPTIVSASALGRQGTTAPSKKITIGVIGVGYQARGHVNYLIRNDDVKVLAVCDVDTTRRENARKIVEDWYSNDKEYKGCSTYIDFRELIARKDIDAVLIGTPDHWHALVATAAMQSGKDVYCEKPLTLTIAEAKLLIDCAHKHKRILQTGSQQRSSKEFRTACEAVRNGRIGKVKQVYVGVGPTSRPCDLTGEPLEPGLDWNMWLGQAPDRPYNSILSPRGIHNFFPNWRNYREFSGGMMTDWGAHHFDIAQWGMGMDNSGPVEVYPAGWEGYPTLTYKYATGVPMSLGNANGVKFTGEDGVIEVNRGFISPESVKKFQPGPLDIDVRRGRFHYDDWIECIKTRQKPICDVEIGARSATVCHLGNICNWVRRPIKWDPVKEEIIGDPEASRWLSRPYRAPWRLG